MRIIAVSDTHGRNSILKKVLNKHLNADVIIHLGDGIDDIDGVPFPVNCSYVAVKGNVDFGSSEPIEKLLVLETKRMFLTHGHKYNVKRGYGALQVAAKSINADVVLFGHTHTPYSDYIDGMYILNPGSLELSKNSIPLFGVIDINEGRIVSYLQEV